jgi:dipeptidyl aminopeptidase/acylaminoacyl peptidase
MVPETAGFDRRCPGVRLPKVAAVVAWFGITDVAGLLDGPDRKDYAVAWLGSRPDRERLARKLSPLTYVRRDGPPVLLIHGGAGPTVPYTQAVPLHEALDRAGVRNRLLTIRGGGHGHFSPAQHTTERSATS